MEYPATFSLFAGYFFGDELVNNTEKVKEDL
jgi:hypothetical protein